ncbi:hypothetical protein BKA61DRAFT_611626 [Leptodontidium sp. MPI-SDFR-AT-0119]|nr:hypothetical protein BKA61DRAFT_611626 [Leptodontidium sp. MPI-SDFR-AT-0119]
MVLWTTTELVSTDTHQWCAKDFLVQTISRFELRSHKIPRSPRIPNSPLLLTPSPPLHQASILRVPLLQNTQLIQSCIFHSLSLVSSEPVLSLALSSQRLESSQNRPQSYWVGNLTSQNGHTTLRSAKPRPFTALTLSRPPSSALADLRNTMPRRSPISWSSQVTAKMVNLSTATTRAVTVMTSWLRSASLTAGQLPLGTTLFLVTTTQRAVPQPRRCIVVTQASRQTSPSCQSQFLTWAGLAFPSLPRSHGRGSRVFQFGKGLQDWSKDWYI